MRSCEHATPCAYSDHVSVRLAEPITFATADGTTHAPLVEAIVNGVPTRLILDTGASDHLLTIDLCEQAGVATEPGEPGTDSTGSSVPSWQAHEVTVRIGEVDFAFSEVVAIGTPPPFRSRGIGGILSPQHLDPGSHVVLDLVGRAGSSCFGTADDLDDWLADSYPGWRTIRLPAVDGDGTVLVEAAINSFSPVVTMLDTGAKATYAAQTAVPGLGEGGVRRSTGRGVGGTESFGVEVPGRELHIGDAALPVDLLIAGHELGSRALRGGHGPVAWHRPGGRRPSRQPGPLAAAVSPTDLCAGPGEVEQQEIDDDPGRISGRVVADVDRVAAIADPAREIGEVRFGRDLVFGRQVVVGHRRLEDALVEVEPLRRVVVDPFDQLVAALVGDDHGRAAIDRDGAVRLPGHRWRVRQHQRGERHIVERLVAVPRQRRVGGIRAGSDREVKFRLVEKFSDVHPA